MKGKQIVILEYSFLGLDLQLPSSACFYLATLLGHN